MKALPRLAAHPSGLLPWARARGLLGMAVRRVSTVLWGGCCLVLVAGTSWAQPLGSSPGGSETKGATDLEKARQYFQFGAQAYAEQQYLDAVEAFEQAYRVTPRPGLRFSIGQAYRKQYLVDQNPDHARRAMSAYRDYVREVKTGERVDEAVQAIEQLEMLTTRQDPAGGRSDADAKPARVTAVMISSSVQRAKLTLDDRNVGSVPISLPVSPGRHSVVVSAPGYHALGRVVWVPKDAVLPMYFPLKPKAARLRIDAPSGARVYLDGLAIGTSPLAPTSTTPGRHEVVVSRNGFYPVRKVVVAQRDRLQVLAFDLRHTKQRTTSWVLMGVGASGLAVGGVLGTWALVNQAKAVDVKDRRETESVPLSDIPGYNTARDKRDSLRLAGAIAGGAGLLVGGIGFSLYLFDDPPPPDELLPDRRPSTVPQGPSFEVSLVPTTDGALFQGRF